MTTDPGWPSSTGSSLPAVPTSDDDEADKTLSLEAYEALADDMPSRLRPGLLSEAENSMGNKHKRSLNEIDVRSSPPSKFTCLSTSEPFSLDGDSGWDLDDSQLYSEESLLLTSDAPPSSPVPPHESVRATWTSTQLLIQFLEAVDVDVQDCGPDTPQGTHVMRVDTEVVMQHTSITQLYGLFRRCARDTEKALTSGMMSMDSTPRTLLDIDAHLLSRSLHLLETTMRQQSQRAELRLDLDFASLEAQVRNSVSLLLCAKCCLIVLGFEQLPKFLFSEELLERCLDILKPALEALVLPLVDACSNPVPAGLAFHLIQGSAPASLVAELDIHLHHVCSTMSLLEPLYCLSSVSVPETLMTRCVFLALAPLFAQDRGSMTTTTKKQTNDSSFTHAHVLRPLRLSCLHILRNLFVFYPTQRSWVLSEILISLQQLPDLRHRKRHFRLGGGQRIYVITALLLQLVQAAAYESPASCEQSLAWFVDADVRETQDKPPSQTNHESVHALASSIAAFLVQRGEEAKAGKNSTEMSYAAIVYAIVEDTLTLVFLPEWPAAPMLLSCFMRLLVNVLHEAKGALEAKAMALDLLGIVAARIRRAEKQPRPRKSQACPPTMSIICACLDVDALRQMQQAHLSLIQRLSTRNKQDPSILAAIRFHRAQFLYDLALAMRSCKSSGFQNNTQVAANVGDSDKTEDPAIALFQHAIATCAQQMDRNDGPVQAADSHLIMRLVLQSNCFVSFSFLVAPLLQFANSSVLSVRLRALRGLGYVADANADFLDDEHVRETIALHITDTSASVREVCVSLLANYLLYMPAKLPVYLADVSERIMDTAVAVRKRVIRFMRDVYSLRIDYDAKLKIMLRMLRCMHDMDPTVQSLALECMTVMLFSDKTRESPAVLARLFADLCTRIRERPSPLEEFLRRLDKDKTSGGDARTTSASALGELVDELISQLFAGDTEPVAMLDQLRVVHILSQTQPNVLTVSRAKQLLPYLEGAQTPAEVAVMEEILWIYSTCVCHMPRTARAFATSLEAILTHSLSRCKLYPGTSALEALVLCFCRVIAFQTHNYELLQHTYHSCLTRFFAIRAESLDTNASLVICLTALLCAHGPWEAAQQPTRLDDVFSHLMDLYATTTRQGAVQHHIPLLIALGSLLSMYPRKFLDPELSATLERILHDGSLQERYLVLRSLLALLKHDMDALRPNITAASTIGHIASTASTSQIAASSADVVAELTGRSYTDAGLVTGLLQRYSVPVLEAVLEVTSAPIQRTASEILNISILQGLSHPMQVVPYLVSLETSQDPILRSRAAQLHRHMMSKHASLLASRYGECVRASFQFQCRLTSHPRGYRDGEQHAEALLQTWFDMLSEHRTARLAFLKALVRLMDVTMGTTCTESDVNLAMYVADNLALLEYRVAEEPLLVIHELKMLHAVTGGQVMSMVTRKLRADDNQRSPSPLTDEEEEGDQYETGSDDDDDDDKTHIPMQKEAHMNGNDEILNIHNTIPSDDNDDDDDDDPNYAGHLALARAACKMRMVQALRQHIKHMYQLPEKKCAKYEPGKRTAMGDRAVARVSSDSAKCVLQFTISTPQTYAEVRQDLEEFVDAGDDVGSESDLDALD